MVLVLVPLRQ